MSVIDWIVIAAIAAIIIGVCIYNIIKFTKMSPEERKQLLVDWIMGAIVVAQNSFSEDGHGAEKLAQVEKYFTTKAPITYKIILKLTKSTNLQDIIETALETIKRTKFS